MRTLPLRLHEKEEEEKEEEEEKGEEIREVRGGGRE